MYSTIDGAKKCAKDMRRLFDDSGFDFALNKCQAATARAMSIGTQSGPRIGVQKGL